MPTPGESIRLPKLLGSAAACGRKGGVLGFWKLWMEKFESERREL